MLLPNGLWVCCVLLFQILTTHMFSFTWGYSKPDAWKLLCFYDQDRHAQLLFLSRRKKRHQVFPHRRQRNHSCPSHLTIFACTIYCWINVSAALLHADFFCQLQRRRMSTPFGLCKHFREVFLQGFCSVHNITEQNHRLIFVGRDV